MKFFHFLLNASSCLFLRAICLRVSILLLKKGGNLSKVTTVLSWKQQKIKYLAASVDQQLLNRVSSA